MFLEFLDKSSATDLSGLSSKGRIDPMADISKIEEWIKKGKGPEHLNYDYASENLLLIWDDTQPNSKQPEINVISDFIDPDIVHVFMNGISMAEVKGDPYLSPDDITLIPLSAAQIVGLTPC
jgi:hypothetical protein